MRSNCGDSILAALYLVRFPFDSSLVKRVCVLWSPKATINIYIKSIKKNGGDEPRKCFIRLSVLIILILFRTTMNTIFLSMSFHLEFSFCANGWIIQDILFHKIVILVENVLKNQDIHLWTSSFQNVLVNS